MRRLLFVHNSKPSDYGWRGFLLIDFCIASATMNKPTSTITVGTKGTAKPTIPDPLRASASRPMKRLNLLIPIPVVHLAKFRAININPAPSAM